MNSNVGLQEQLHYTFMDVHKELTYATIVLVGGA